MRTTRNSMPDNTRKSVIELIQARLADSLDLASQAKQAHWNVTGPSFNGLHALFDQIHAEALGHTDMLAERLVALGGQAHGTLRSAAALTTLEEYPLDAMDQSQHIEAFTNVLADFGGSIRKAIDEAADIGDQGTSDLFTEISRAVDKSLWMVEAHGV